MLIKCMTEEILRNNRRNCVLNNDIVDVRDHVKQVRKMSFIVWYVRVDGWINFYPKVTYDRHDPYPDSRREVRMFQDMLDPDDDGETWMTKDERRNKGG